ncbi:hypothetical protein ACTWP4_13965 [Gracilibacillus sp. D59]|uniref:hypothetical protein n=1 Tax=Gracilibacillus sp. D59 TaxID=3457434 RepID=UPI003FCDDF83
MESATILNPNTSLTSMTIFRETELPRLSVKGVKLPPNAWAFLLRSLWFLGYSEGCESLAHAKQRAKKAARLLIEHAQEYESVVLVGHGFFNILIVKELLRLGWKGNRKTNSKHWQCTTYYFHA